MKKFTAIFVLALILLGSLNANVLNAEETTINSETQTTEINESSTEANPTSEAQLATECQNIMPTGTVNFANATLVVPEGACPIMVSFSSYSHTGTIVPYNEQVLVDNITDTYGPGTYELGPLELTCNWQTDLYVGPVQAQLLEVGGHDQSQYPVLGYNYMEHQVCEPEYEDMVLTVIKNVVGGTATSGQFMIQVSGGDATPDAFPGNASGTTVSINASSTYSVTESPVSGYSISYSEDCSGVSINQYHPKTCVITNTLIDTNEDCDVIMPTGTVNFANATLVVPEGACPIMVSFSSYTFATSIVPYDKQILVDNITDTYGPGTHQIGPLELRCNWQTDLYVGPVQAQLLAVGGHDQSQYPVLGYNYMENQICDEGSVIVTKEVINNDGGTKQISDFPLFVGTSTVSSGATTTLTIGTYKVSETYDSSLYTQSFSGDCDASGNITISTSTVARCLITNNDIADDDDDNDGGSSSRSRSRSRGTVQGINAESEPQVLGVVYTPTLLPGLPDTGLGELSDTNSGGTMIIYGLISLIAFNLLIATSFRRRNL